MTRARKPWADHATVQAVTHEPAPSGLPEAWGRLPIPSLLDTVQAVSDAGKAVRLDALAREHLARGAACWDDSAPGPSGIVSALAGALDAVRPVQVVLGGVVLSECSVALAWVADDDDGFDYTGAAIGAAVGPDGRWFVEVPASERGCGWREAAKGKAATAAEAMADAERAASGLLDSRDDAPLAYRWPVDFSGWTHTPRGAVEDVTVLAAMAVGVALWSRLPTADEVAAWMDADEPRVAVVEVGL